MTAISVTLVSVALVCVSALAGWTLWLAHLKWALTQRAVQRDEVLATVEPRVRALEEAARNGAWAKTAR